MVSGPVEIIKYEYYYMKLNNYLDSIASFT